MKKLITAIQQRDGTELQRMAGNEPAKYVPALPEEARMLFNGLFVQLRAAFPAATANIKSQEELNELRIQWVRAFVENGIRSTKQIEAGMIIARRQESPFLPSPGQFVAWCKQGGRINSGLLDDSELVELVLDFSKRKAGYSSIEAYPWPSNAAYWMATRLYDSMRSHNWGRAELQREARLELQRMARRIEAGEIIPEPEPRLQVPKRKLLTAEEQKAKISELREKLGLKGNNS